jgi:hypothetical protein
MTDPSKWDWSAIPETSAREVLRLAELTMADLLHASLAADARATTLSGIFAGVSAAGLAAAVATGAMRHPDPGVVVVLGVMSAGFLGASFVCVHAGRPTEYFAAGYEPAKLQRCAADARWLVGYTVESLDRRIAHNKERLRRSAVWTAVAHKVALISVALGALTFAISRLI